MNLKLKRLVRTTTSEQYALYDLDQKLDQTHDGGQSSIIGKVDLHYTNEGVYGTLLLWSEATRELPPTQRRALVHAILAEITQPMGVPNEFVVEFFMPMLDYYELFHNVGPDEDDLDGDELEDDELDGDDLDGDDLDGDDLDQDELEDDDLEMDELALDDDEGDQVLNETVSPAAGRDRIVDGTMANRASSDPW